MPTAWGGVVTFSMRAHSLPEVTGAQPKEGFAKSTKTVLGAFSL